MVDQVAKKLNCPICGIEVERYGAPHKCDPFLISIAPEFRPARKLRDANGNPVRIIKPRPAEEYVRDQVKVGRPRKERRGATFLDVMPWLTLGVSQRTFYRRRAEYKKLMASKD